MPHKRGRHPSRSRGVGADPDVGRADRDRDRRARARSAGDVIGSSSGLRHAPYGDRVPTSPVANWSRLVLPTTTAPASTSACTAGACSAGCSSECRVAGRRRVSRDVDVVLHRDGPARERFGARAGGAAAARTASGSARRDPCAELARAVRRGERRVRRGRARRRSRERHQRLTGHDVLAARHHDAHDASGDRRVAPPSPSSCSRAPRADRRPRRAGRPRRRPSTRSPAGWPRRRSRPAATARRHDGPPAVLGGLRELGLGPSAAFGVERVLLAGAELADLGRVRPHERRVIGEPQRRVLDPELGAAGQHVAAPVEQLLGAHLEEAQLVEEAQQPRLGEVGRAPEAVPHRHGAADELVAARALPCRRRRDTRRRSRPRSPGVHVRAGLYFVVTSRWRGSIGVATGAPRYTSPRPSTRYDAS